MNVILETQDFRIEQSKNKCLVTYPEPRTRQLDFASPTTSVLTTLPQPSYIQTSYETILAKDSPWMSMSSTARIHTPSRIY